MKKQTIPWPVTNIEKCAATLPRNEYLLILRPENDLLENILAEKRIFHKKYKAITAINSRPHITLVKFFQLHTMEEKIIHRFYNIAAAQSPFLLKLNGFGSFPSHTIYFNVISQMAVQELVKQIRPVQHLLKSREEKPHLIMEPHITLAYKLLPWQYEQGWMEYEHKLFSGACVVETMLLLKRKDEEKYYRPVKEFSFTAQMKKIIQGNLFKQ